MSCVWTAPLILSDASIMACDQMGYGRIRTWASVAWIVLAPISGHINEMYGIQVGIAVFVVGSLLALPAGVMLPLESLQRAPPPPFLAEEGGAHDRELHKALSIIKLIEAVTELGYIPPFSSSYGFAENASRYTADHMGTPTPSQALPEEEDGAKSPFASGRPAHDSDESHTSKLMEDLVTAPTIAQLIPGRTGEVGSYETLSEPLLYDEFHLQDVSSDGEREDQCYNIFDGEDLILMAGPSSHPPAQGLFHECASASDILQAFKSPPNIGALPVSRSSPSQGGMLGETPSETYRSAAIRRLSQVFSSRDGDQGRPPLSSEQHGLTPVWQYLQRRQEKCAAKHERRKQRAVARQAEIHDEPLTPPRPGTWGAALKEKGVEEPGFDVLREALELETASSSEVNVIVSMLGKKIERMAKETGTVAPRRIWRDQETVAYLFIVSLLGFGHSLLGSFLFLYLAELGARESLMGYILLANALPELPVFYNFGTILSRMGMNTLLVFSTAVLGLRQILLTILPVSNLWWTLPIETLHGITFAAGWSACAINASKLAPPGLETTFQALFQGLWTGLGSTIAGIVGGLLYHYRGPEYLFKMSGYITLGGALVCGILFFTARYTFLMSK